MKKKVVALVLGAMLSMASGAVPAIAAETSNVSVDASEGETVDNMSDGMDGNVSEDGVQSTVKDAVDDETVISDSAEVESSGEDMDQVSEGEEDSEPGVTSDDVSVEVESVMENQRLLSSGTPQINASSVELYALDEWAQEYISIPSSYAQKFQLVVKNAEDVSYYVESGNSVTVSSDGMITPNISTWYWIGSVSCNYPVDGYTSTSTEINFGDSVIRVCADGQYFTVNVTLTDYAETYADGVMDAYIAKNVTDDMSAKEKVTEAAKFVAGYDYDASYGSCEGLILSGGGNCYASTDAVIKFCEKLGYEAWSRNANRDPGAGSGHRNAVVYAGGKYYVVDAGYTGNAPRYYRVNEKSSLFSYCSVDGGIEVYQYDGPSTEGTLTVPSQIDGETVVGIGEEFVSFKNFSKVVLPETLTYIGERAFYSCENLTTLKIPKNVSSIGEFAFTNDNNLTNFSCDSSNSSYKIENGVLYDKKGTTVIACPAAESVSLPGTVTSIGDYAFFRNDNLTKIVIPKTVTSIGEKALGCCGSLTTISIKGAGLKSVGAYAFYQSEITEIFLPSSVQSLGDYAFTYCHSLKSITILNDNLELTAEIMDGVPKEITLKCNRASKALEYAKTNSLSYVILDGWEGLHKASNGKWYYYTNDAVDTSYTGLAKNKYGWWYVKSGKLDLTYTGMAKNAYGWWYVKKGKLDTSYTGMAKNKYGWWYMKNGKLDTTYTGMAKNSSGWWYIKNGKLDTTYTGMAKNSSGWWYMKNGKLDTTYTGLAKNSYGWWYMKNGKLDTTHTGMARNSSGWWYIKNGKLDTTYTGMAKNSYGWWYMTNGRLDTTYTGIATNKYGSWYMKNGKLQSTYSGKVKVSGKTYTIKNGKVV